MSTMRLLWFNLATDTNDPILGFTSRWLQVFAQRTERISVLTMRAGHVEMPGNVQVYSIGKEKGYSEPRRAVQFYRDLLRILREGRVDVCFSHMIPIFTILAAPVLKARGIPIITWYAHRSLPATLKLAHLLSDRIVTSVATAYPYKRDKLTVVGQGIDTSLFSPDGGTRPENLPLILCVGRLSPVKDHSTLLMACALVRERRGPSFRVVLLGGPATPQDFQYVRSLQHQVHDLELEDMVRFESPVPMTSLPSWYRRCAVHVNLTPTGFGDKVAWEAMACGRPCVVANEGFRESLAQWTDRLLFQHGDAEHLAERLHWVLSLSEGEQEQIGRHLQEQVVRFHGLNGLADRLVALFREVQESKNDWHRKQSTHSL